MLRANRQRASEQHRVQSLLPNAAVVYAVTQHVEETFEYLRSEDRLSLPSGNVMVALASVGQLLGLVEGDIERLLNLAEKEPSFILTGMSYSEFVDAVRCLAVLHGHLALEALPALQVPDLSHALYKTYMSYSQAVRPHPSGAICRCRLVAGEPPPRLFWESFLRLCRDAGFVQPEGPMSPATLERIWLGSSSVCEKHLPEHMSFAEFLRVLAVVAGQIKAEVFVPVAALGMAQEVPALKPVPNSYRLKHYKEVPLNLGGNWSLPHLTYEALTKAVQEGRQYEYTQFLRDAQETALRDEVQQRHLRAGAVVAADKVGGAAASDDNGASSAAKDASGFYGSSARRGGAAATGMGNVAGNGKVRPWSAGLTVLSPHPRRPGAAEAAALAAAAHRAEMAGEATGPSGHGPTGSRGVPPEPEKTPTAATAAAAASNASNGGGGGTSSGVALAPTRPPVPVLSTWLVGDYTSTPMPSSPSHPGYHQPLSPSTALISPAFRALERSRSAAAAPGSGRPSTADPGSGGDGGGDAASLWAWDRDRERSPCGPSPMSPGSGPRGPPAPPGMEGGGRVFQDSARPRAIHSTSFTSSSSPRVSLVAYQAAAAAGPGPGSAGAAGAAPSAWGEGVGGARSTLGRPLSRRSISSPADGPLAVGGSCSVGGSVASPRFTSGGEAAEHYAAGMRELRREVEGRLAALEDQGRAVMQLLTQLQTQVAALATQQLPAQPRGGSAAAGSLAAVSASAASPEGAVVNEVRRSDFGIMPLPPIESQQQQQQHRHQMAGEGAGARPPGSPTCRSRSPSRPSSAVGFHDGRDTARYGVVVRTSDLPGAGTNADVFLTIYGTKGDTGERLLSNGTYNFERGQVSTFVFTAADVGEVQCVRVRMRIGSSSSSFSSNSPSWHLDAIQVASSATGTRYRFPHCGWVDNVLGRECVLYCKGTAPDTDEDPPGWQAPPPGLATGSRASQQALPPNSPRQQKSPPQSPSRQQSQQPPSPAPAPAPWTDKLELVVPSPIITPEGAEGGRRGLSRLSNPGLPSPPASAADSPVTPPGFLRGILSDAAELLPLERRDNSVAAAAEAGVPAPLRSDAAADSPAQSYAKSQDVGNLCGNAIGGGGGGGGGGGIDGVREGTYALRGEEPSGDRLLAARVADLQQRMQTLEETQAECAKRAAAAIAAAVLVRVPAPLLATVRYGGKRASMDAHHGSAGAGASSDDNALMLLADLLTHLHHLAEQGHTAATAADSRAAAALDATRRQQSRLTQLQFELSATSEAAEQAAKRAAEASEGLEATVQGAVRREVEDALAAPSPVLPAPEGEPGKGDLQSVGALAEEVRQCKARLGLLSVAVKRMSAEQSGAATAVSELEALLADTRAYQARLAAALAEAATCMAVQRRVREQGRDTDASDALAGGGAWPQSLHIALASFQRELLQLAQAVSNSTGYGSGAPSAESGERAGGRSSEERGSASEVAQPNEEKAGGDSGAGVIIDDDADSVPSRSSYASV